ncbi:unnamed protein product [Bathycoccus prasinos]
MSAGTSKETLRKTATLVKSHLKVSKVKLQSKIKSVDGLEKILPRNFWKPAAGEQLILKNHSVLYLAYLCVVTISIGVFVGQWTYYGGLKETITDITDDSSSNEYDSCKALQNDSLYMEKWTYEECLPKYSAPSAVNMIKADSTLDITSGSWGYGYYPFGANSRSFRPNENCSPSYPTNEAVYKVLLPNFDVSTSCQGASLANSCGATIGSVNIQTKEVTFRPVYVTSNDTVLTLYGAIFFYPDSGPCEAYEKECVTQNINQIYALGEGEACHPCEHFKSNSPFLCTKSKYKTTLEILSLSVSNTLAVFSFLVALVPMILSSFANRLSTIRVSKEEGDDGGGDDEDDSV